MTVTRKSLRCAIYTRKSTEHNLDLEFNSLDAQREACEAYIKSQAHEGWRLIPDEYDDGGISGASLERPALQRLLSEIGAGKIDVVVVYKVDRLTRSLTDFAKLVELFDKHTVSFVSITQSFNTTTSMGRLTLNVLLSFAQFEREVIGERVRDKVAASKRKGLWMGGPVPLGYASVNKKLVIVPEEAETIRTIFRRYLELSSVQALAEDLARAGVLTKKRDWSNGRVIGGVQFGVGPLAYLLKNRVYVGEVVHRKEIFQGDHAPILERELFDAVQNKLVANAVDRRLRLRSSPSLLVGRIFDDRGNKMSPSHTNKQGVRYRYYVSHAVIQKRKSDAGRVSRAPAHEIEELVLNGLRNHLVSTGDAELVPGDRNLIERHVSSVVVGQVALAVHLLTATESGDASEPLMVRNNNAADQSPEMLSLPWTPTAISAVKGVLHEPENQPLIKSESRDAILTAIATAIHWVDDLTHGRVQSVAEIAKRENKGERYIRLLMKAAFVSPQLVTAIAEGVTSAEFTVTQLIQTLPYLWREQQK